VDAVVTHDATHDPTIIAVVVERDMQKGGDEGTADATTGFIITHAECAVAGCVIIICAAIGGGVHVLAGVVDCHRFDIHGRRTIDVLRCPHHGVSNELLAFEQAKQRLFLPIAGAVAPRWTSSVRSGANCNPFFQLISCIYQSALNLHRQAKSRRYRLQQVGAATPAMSATLLEPPTSPTLRIHHLRLTRAPTTEDRGDHLLGVLAADAVAHTVLRCLSESDCGWRSLLALESTCRDARRLSLEADDDIWIHRQTPRQTSHHHLLF
jgi:hypothetical protein